jgi:hypothetical protein
MVKESGNRTTALTPLTKLHPDEMNIGTARDLFVPSTGFELIAIRERVQKSTQRPQRQPEDAEWKYRWWKA